MMSDQPPQIDKVPAPCPVCDTAVALGLLTAACETVSGEKKSKCYNLLKPLEAGTEKPAKTLENVLVELSEDDPVNEVIDRMNLLMMEATARAKEKLIAAGKIDKDGFPKV